MTPLPIAVLLVAAAAALPAQRRSAPVRDTEHVKYFKLRSDKLSQFWGRDMFVEAGVVLPPDRREGERLAVCYSVHGFGSSHRSAWSRGAALVRRMQAGGYPRMLYVYLNAHFPLGHHVFADSVNNGPWGAALTEEFIPALEKQFGAHGKPGARFLTGHSSGGWSSLWLQVAYPDFFGGTWSTAPDSVDFRDFTGIDVYRYDNAYTDLDGEPIQLMRRGDQWRMSIRQFVERETSRRAYGGQFASFDAVFSPRGEDGRPMPMFDRKTGAIDRFVARSWEKYDIRLVLKRNWKTLGPKLRGKIRVYMGTLDTFRLEGALYLLRDELKELGSDAEIVFAEGRSHGSLMAAHELWPDGLLNKIHGDMAVRAKKLLGR